MAAKRRRQDARAGSSTSQVDSEEPKMDIKSILKDIEFLGSSHMSWKEKKDLENKKVVSLGGKPPKKHRLPLSVARVAMKKQKEREEKMLQERALLGRFGTISSSGGKKAIVRRRPEDRGLRTAGGNFRNGILDVNHLLHAPAPRKIDTSFSFNEGRKSKGGGGKKGGRGKRKGGGKKRH